MSRSPTLSIAIVCYSPDISLLSKTIASVNAAIGYAQDGGELGEIVLWLIDNGLRRHYAIGATQGVSPLFPDVTGTLRMRPTCPSAAATVHRVDLAESLLHEYYQNLLASCPDLGSSTGKCELRY